MSVLDAPESAMKLRQRARGRDMKILADIGSVLKATVVKWQRDRAERLSAALAFYTIFSIAPLLVVVVAITGWVFGADAIRGELVGQIQSLIGKEAAVQIQTLIQNVSNPATNLSASIIGGITLLFGATAVFGQLKDALNTIWGTVPRRGGRLWGMIRGRLLSMAMILGICFLLLVSLILSAALAALGRWTTSFVPDFPIWLAQAAEFLLSYFVITLLFAMIYKILPDVRISYGDVAIGAAITALFFNIGKYLIGLYLGRSSLGSVFGAAGSLAVILTWVYYSASIFLLGAVFTRVYSERWGSLATRAGQPGR